MKSLQTIQKTCKPVSYSIFGILQQTGGNADSQSGDVCVYDYNTGNGFCGYAKKETGKMLKNI